MTPRIRALALVLGGLLVLSLPVGAVGTVGAQEAGNDAPTPVLDAPDTIERGQTYELDGNSSTGDIETYHWDYNPDSQGADRSTTERDSIWTYYEGERGQITVRLGVSGGANDVQWTNETINVTSSSPPNASIDSSADFTVKREQFTWFNSTSTDDSGIADCEWTFEFGPTVERTSGDGLGWGDGSTNCAKNYAFTVPGTYNVTLTVTDLAGNTDTTTREVEVVPKYDVREEYAQPNASLRGPDAIERRSTYKLDASNSTSEDDVRYYIRESGPDHWYSDEENLGLQTQFATHYDGQYDPIDVAVGIRTEHDQTDWAWETIDVLPMERPTAVVEGPDSAAVGDESVFDASESTDNDRIRRYSWTFNDTESGETVHTEDGVTGSYQFTEPGTYDVTVRVYDYVNHSLDGAEHYGVATKTVTVTEDGETANEAPTVSASANPQTVTVGEDTTLAADVGDGDGSVESVEWELGDGSSTTGESATYSYDGAGTYTATVTVTDDDGATANDSVDVAVEPESDDGDSSDGDSGAGDDPTDAPDDSDTDDSDSSETTDPSDESESSEDDSNDDQSAPSGSSGGSAGGAPPADSDGPDATVEVEHANESTDLVAISDASADETVAIDLEANTSDGSVGYQRFDVRSANNDAFSLTVTAHNEVPRDASAPAVEGFDTLSYLTVDGAEGADLSEGSLEFRVSKERLTEADADAEDVALRRVVDGESEAVDVERISEIDDAYVYRAATGTVTSYAVGVDRPALSVTDLSVADGEHAPGDTVEVTATVANAGQAAGTMDVALVMGGTVSDEQSVEVAARDSGTATFAVPVADAGEHTLSAGDASTTLSVTSQESTTETDDSAAEATRTDESRTPGTAFGGVSVIGLVAVLVLIAGAGLLALRR